MRTKRAAFNFLFSILLEVVLVIAGFIVPTLIIGAFGSEAFGIKSSVTNFMGYLMLLQAGIGGVVQAALYKPVAERDHATTSKIVRASQQFFTKIAIMTLLYLALLSVILPILIDSSFSFGYTALLVIILGMATFSQYYFGMTYELLLFSDQRSYIKSIFQMITMVLNTVVIFLFVVWQFPLYIVFLASTSVLFVKPILLNIYVSRNYHLDKHIAIEENTIAQKWDGIGHTLAYFVSRRSGIMIVSVFTNLKEVSVFAIYMLITTGLYTFINSITSTVQSAFGNMIAKMEYNVLHKNYNAFVCIVHVISIVLFSTALLMVIPFIQIYTHDFSDANYNRPLFAYLLLIAELLFCLRLPLASLVSTAGHYKQTKRGAFIEAGINLTISILLVMQFGIVGVAIGAIIAVTYRTIDLMRYLHHQILLTSYPEYAKRFILTAVNFLAIIAIVHYIPMSNAHTYMTWVVQSIFIFIWATGLTVALHLIFYRKEMQFILTLARKVLSK